MKDELSLEILIEKLDWWRKIAHIGGGCKDRDICEQAYSQIKSLLTPVPDEKVGWLKQLIENMKDSLKEGRRFYPTDRDIDNLKKLYDNLREGKEG